jgi:phosphatidylglycerophosphate synthase
VLAFCAESCILPVFMKPPSYQYVCVEHSVLYPFLKKHVWGPIVPRLPAWLSPNTLTLAGSFFAWAGLAILLLLKPEDSTWFLVPAACNFLYLSLDNMDGMQARRAGRSSPLGEFLDHWLDAFNTGLMVFGYAVAMSLPMSFGLIMLGLVMIAYFATFWEHYQTGALELGRGGSIEGVLYICGMYVLVALFGHAPIATDGFVGPLSFSTFTLMGVAVAFVLTILKPMWRVGRAWADFVPLTVVYGAFLLWGVLGEIGMVAMGFLILFVGAHLGGRVVVARVLGERFHAGDPLLYFLVAACMAVALGAELSSDGHTLASLPILSYLLFRLAGDFTRTVTTLKHHLLPRELLARLLFPRA